jgi:mono/diheme cytochrome c family protein
MKSLIATAVFVAALMGGSAAAQTAAVDIGKHEYLDNCAVCHGVTGKGDGPMVKFGYQKAPNLTTLSKRNKGVFPFAHVYRVIDGRQEVKGHGTREMPIWGKEYSKEAWTQMHLFGAAFAAQSIVEGRIVALIGYIHSLQEE